MYRPDWSKPFQVETDSSRFGIGAVLAQENNSSIRPVRFTSHSFNNTESCWETMHQKRYAVKWGLEQFRPYVLGKHTKVITDHANLSFLHSVQPQKSKLARWCLQMAEFDFFIEHKPGVKNIVLDYLSRCPVSDEGDNLVIPPPDVITFITSVYSLDVCDCTPDTVISTFYAPSVCLNLICSPVSPVVTSKNTRQCFDQKKTQAVEPVIHTNSTNLQNISLTQIKTIDQLKVLSPPKSTTIATCQGKPLSLSHAKFAELQQKDPLLKNIMRFILSNNDPSVLSDLPQQEHTHVMSRCSIVDGLLMYSDEYMDSPEHLQIFVPADIELQRNLLQSYHDSPTATHQGRDATPGLISRDFYWRNQAKHVWNR